MNEIVELSAQLVVVTKQNVLTDSYLRVMQVYFINLSSFRRFIANIQSRKELKYKIKCHLSKYNKIFSLNRPPAELQADCLVLFYMAEKLGSRV
ncbi:MAG: hypothetical protein V7749_00155 [Cocleimonas sp.]|jgi:hypothetical protein